MEILPISVIIPTKNVERTLEECLSSVQMNNPAEIILVDGNSTDKTLDIARKFTDRIYSDEGRGFNYGHQLGTEMAVQEYIAYVDADVTLPQGTLATLLAELKSSDCVSMQAKILAANCSTYWERATDWHIKIGQARKGGGLSAAVLRKDTRLKYKPDTFLKGADDYDFYIRMKKEGFRVGTSSAFVYHHHRANLKGLAKQSFRDGQDTSRFVMKYGPWHVGFYPPLTRIYWIGICLIRGKPYFIPYFVVKGVAETVGMVNGFRELAGEALRRKQVSDGR